MNHEIESIQTNQKISLNYYYDENVEFNLKLIILFFLVDLVIMTIRKRFMNTSIVIHHVSSIFFCLISAYSKYPHHYHANLFLCSEIVSCLSIVKYFAKKYNSKTLRKFYHAQYLFLTVFVRGNIWLMVLTDIMTSKVSILCYIGLLPFPIMDIMWAKQCIVGLMK